MRNAFHHLASFLDSAAAVPILPGPIRKRFSDGWQPHVPDRSRVKASTNCCNFSERKLPKFSATVLQTRLQMQSGLTLKPRVPSRRLFLPRTNAASNHRGIGLRPCCKPNGRNGCLDIALELQVSSSVAACAPINAPSRMQRRVGRSSHLLTDLILAHDLTESSASICRQSCA